MQYTHKEMLKNFPVIYECTYLGGEAQIKENFEFLTKNNGYYSSYANTVDEARTIIKDKWLAHKRESLGNYENYFKEYDDYSFVKKIIERNGFNNVKRNYNMMLERFVKEPVPEIIKLNEDLTYEFMGGDLKEGQQIFVVVTQENLLPMGFYELNISSLSYSKVFVDGKVNLIPHAYYQAKLEDPNSKVILNYSDGKMNSNYTYHEVFLDKQKALDFYQNYLREQKEILNKEIEHSEKLRGHKP